METSLLAASALDASGSHLLLYHQSFSAVGFANAFYLCSEESPKLRVRLLIANTPRGEDVSSKISTR